MDNIAKAFIKLKSYCEREKYKGWDPYDGLNSKLFNKIPFVRSSRFFRLAVIQFFKRCPINIRKIVLIPTQYNAKGIGLFLSGYCNLYDAVGKDSKLSRYLGPKEELIDKINQLANLVISLKSKGPYHGACWGYGFGWQSKAFYLPPNTPTVVATSFVVEALLKAYKITKNNNYLTTAISSADFIINDLNRISKTNGFMFSYSPLDHRAVYNATLLGTKTLSLIYDITKDEKIKEIIKLTIDPIISVQNEDGSFPHSDQVGNKWRDNFHTGFKLESLQIYADIFHDNKTKYSIQKGYSHWINRFFDRENGIAKYYENDTPNSVIDLHCLAQSIPTLYKLGKLSDETQLVSQMIEWAKDNMQSTKGFYYYQKKGKSINKIRYMRWPNAWMFYGLSYYIKFLSENETN